MKGFQKTKHEKTRVAERVRTQTEIRSDAPTLSRESNKISDRVESQNSFADRVESLHGVADLVESLNSVSDSTESLKSVSEGSKNASEGVNTGKKAPDRIENGIELWSYFKTETQVFQHFQDLATGKEEWAPVTLGPVPFNIYGNAEEEYYTVQVNKYGGSTLLLYNIPIHKSIGFAAHRLLFGCFVNTMDPVHESIGFLFPSMDVMDSFVTAMEAVIKQAANDQKPVPNLFTLPDGSKRCTIRDSDINFSATEGGQPKPVRWDSVKQKNVRLQRQSDGLWVDAGSENGSDEVIPDSGRSAPSATNFWKGEEGTISSSEYEQDGDKKGLKARGGGLSEDSTKEDFIIKNRVEGTRRPQTVVIEAPPRSREGQGGVGASSGGVARIKEEGLGTLKYAREQIQFIPNDLRLINKGQGDFTN